MTVEVGLGLGVPEVEESGVQPAAGGSIGLLPQIAVDAQVMGDGHVGTFSDFRIRGRADARLTANLTDGDLHLLTCLTQHVTKCSLIVAIFLHFFLLFVKY